MHRSLLLSTVLFGGVWLGAECAAFAEEPALPVGAVERPAPVSVDIDTGARTVIVPSGCTSTTRPNRQVVVLCPFAPPDAKTPEVSARRPTLPPPPKPKKEWYGWQILIADGASLAAGLGVGLATHRDSGAGPGITTAALGYALAPAIVHWANGQVGPGFGSASLRVGAPLVLGAWGLIAGAAVSQDQNVQWTAAAVGFGAGIVGAIVVDVAVLAHKPAAPVTSRSAKTPQLSWFPTANYDAKRGATTVGLAGTF